MNFSDFLEQCITDCIEGDGPDADLHRQARANLQAADRAQREPCNAPEKCCCDSCWTARLVKRLQP